MKYACTHDWCTSTYVVHSTILMRSAILRHFHYASSSFSFINLTRSIRNAVLQGLSMARQLALHPSIHVLWSETCTVASSSAPPQVTDTLSTAEALLGELAGFSSFRTEASELREELRGYQREQVNSWSRQVLAAIDHPSEPLR